VSFIRQLSLLIIQSSSYIKNSTLYLLPFFGYGSDHLSLIIVLLSYSSVYRSICTYDNGRLFYRHFRAFGYRRSISVYILRIISVNTLSVAILSVYITLYRNESISAIVLAFLFAFCLCESFYDEFQRGTLVLIGYSQWLRLSLFKSIVAIITFPTFILLSSCFHLQPVCLASLYLFACSIPAVIPLILKPKMFIAFFGLIRLDWLSRIIAYPLHSLRFFFCKVLAVNTHDRGPLMALDSTLPALFAPLLISSVFSRNLSIVFYSSLALLASNFFVSYFTLRRVNPLRPMFFDASRGVCETPRLALRVVLELTGIPVLFATLVSVLLVFTLSFGLIVMPIAFVDLFILITFFLVASICWSFKAWFDSKYHYSESGVPLLIRSARSFVLGILFYTASAFVFSRYAIHQPYIVLVPLLIAFVVECISFCPQKKPGWSFL
jgi:hypothetical protein